MRLNTNTLFSLSDHIKSHLLRNKQSVLQSHLFLFVYVRKRCLHNRNFRTHVPPTTRKPISFLEPFHFTTRHHSPSRTVTTGRHAEWLRFGRVIHWQLSLQHFVWRCDIYIPRTQSPRQDTGRVPRAQRPRRFCTHFTWLPNFRSLSH